MTAALRLTQLQKTYGNGHRALDGIDLEVQAGDFFALLGPNGAGKSTLIGIVSSLVNKSAGRVEVFGHDLDRAPEAAKRCLGVVPQEFNCNNFEKVIDVIITQAGYYGVPAARARAQAEIYLRQLGLWEKRHTQVRELSGGMRRRLMIARALAHEPRLLILDEPTAGVDIEIRRSMWRFVEELNAQGVTIILTTHYLEEAEALCRNIAIIDHGAIVEHAPMRTLLAKLNRETFVLYLQTPLAPEALREAPYPMRALDAEAVEVELREGDDLNTLFRWLDARNVRVASLRNKANRLEQLFLDLTQPADPPPTLAGVQTAPAGA